MVDVGEDPLGRKERRKSTQGRCEVEWQFRRAAQLRERKENAKRPHRGKGSSTEKRDPPSLSPQSAQQQLGVGVVPLGDKCTLH